MIHSFIILTIIFIIYLPNYVGKYNGEILREYKDIEKARIVNFILNI